MPKNRLAQKIAEASAGNEAQLEEITKWVKLFEPHEEHLRHDRRHAADAHRMNTASSLLEVLHTGADKAYEQHERAITWLNWQQAQDIRNRALWEPRTGTTDNIGLVQIEGFFQKNELITKDLLDSFALFKTPNLNSDPHHIPENDTIAFMYRLLDRYVNPKDARDSMAFGRCSQPVFKTTLPLKHSGSLVPLLSYDYFDY